MKNILNKKINILKYVFLRFPKKTTDYDIDEVV